MKHSLSIKMVLNLKLFCEMAPCWRDYRWQLDLLISFCFLLVASKFKTAKNRKKCLNYCQFAVLRVMFPTLQTVRNALFSPLRGTVELRTHQKFPQWLWMYFPSGVWSAKEPADDLNPSIPCTWYWEVKGWTGILIHPPLQGKGYRYSY